MSAPFSASDASAAAARVIAFAATIGLLEDVSVRALDLPTWTRVVRRLRDLGIGKIRVAATSPQYGTRSEELVRSIDVIYDAIEASPMPGSEWRSMRELLKDELLERLVNVSRQSIQRYFRGERETPQKVADRLHTVALIASDLAGSYNEFGIRRWFERPRAQLAGKAPAEVLKGDWNPDADGPRRVRALAAALSGAMAA